MMSLNSETDTRLQEIFRLAEQVSRTSGYYVVQIFVCPEGQQQLHISEAIKRLVKSQILPKSLPETPALTAPLNKIIGHLVGLSLSHQGKEYADGGDTSSDSSALYEQMEWTAAEERIIQAIEGAIGDAALARDHQPSPEREHMW